MLLNLKRSVACAAIAFVMVISYAVPAFAWEEHDYLISDGHGYFEPSYLTIHSTANPGATAWNHVQYWQSQGDSAYMTQWVSDWTDGGTVYQVAPGNAVTWHVGNGNWYSVGIEICEATNQQDFQTGFETAAKWAAYYLNEQGWGTDRMVSHNQARYLWGGTDHVDPIPYFEKWGKTWDDFVWYVQCYMDGSESEPSQPENEPTDVGGGIADAAYGVMQGWYGNLPERQYNLEAAGFNYAEVQAYVNRVYYGIGNGNAGSDWLADVAYDVYIGNYGNGRDRVNRLTAAGYDYQTVQSYVNSVYYGI